MQTITETFILRCWREELDNLTPNWRFSLEPLSDPQARVGFADVAPLLDHLADALRGLVDVDDDDTVDRH